MGRKAMTEARICRGCKAEIRIIRTGTVYKNVMVDADPVWVKLQRGGDPFWTEDGRTVSGFVAGDADDDPDSNFIEAYVPHLSHCQNNGRAPRQRHRPSGYR